MHQKMLAIKVIAGALMLIGTNTEPSIGAQVWEMLNEGYPVDSIFRQHLSALDATVERQCLALLKALRACTFEEFRRCGLPAFFVPQPQSDEWEPAPQPADWEADSSIWQ